MSPLLASVKARSPSAGEVAFDVSGSALKLICSSCVLFNFKFSGIDEHARKYAMKVES
jgi:hypothetical protein